ncbi:MAG TPA: cytidyltransferase [Balneola sp.]|nr:cytidyltransferase [Balneola sp.]|tara:strand:+ start:5052 stop:5462 length:411 start_codon:yes stop_codon:yes gene_type:complete
MFDWKKPTVQMLGRWQPWHDGHTELFKKALTKTGQVCIMIRDVCGADAGMGNADNPFSYKMVKENIETSLRKHGYHCGSQYEIISVPNIVDISYGRDVGYTFSQHDLGEQVHSISATKIRARMREEGTLYEGGNTK